VLRGGGTGCGMDEPRDRAAPEAPGPPPELPGDEPDSGTETSADPYAREAAIEQLTGPEDADT
jgi:hypothetical protein